jgi:hypothetical protein
MCGCLLLAINAKESTCNHNNTDIRKIAINMKNKKQYLLFLPRQDLYKTGECWAVAGRFEKGNISLELLYLCCTK